MRGLCDLGQKSGIDVMMPEQRLVTRLLGSRIDENPDERRMQPVLVKAEPGPRAPDSMSGRSSSTSVQAKRTRR